MNFIVCPIDNHARCAFVLMKGNTTFALFIFFTTITTGFIADIELKFNKAEILARA